MREADAAGGRHVVRATALVGHRASAGPVGQAPHAPARPARASDRCEAGTPCRGSQPASHPPTPVLVTVMVAVLAVGCGPHPHRAAPPRAPVTQTPHASPSPVLWPEDSPQLAAVRFTTAMLARSYLDPTATAYLDRAAPYMTVRLAVRLRRQANAIAQAEWDAYRASRAIRTVVVRHVALHSPPPAPDGAAVTLTADETTSSANGGRQGGQEQVAVILVRSQGRWLVDYTSLDRW